MKLVLITYKGTTYRTCSDNAKIFGKAHQNLAIIFTNKRDAQCFMTLDCVTYATFTRLTDTKGYLLKLTFNEHTTITINEI